MPELNDLPDLNLWKELGIAGLVLSAVGTASFFAIRFIVAIYKDIRKVDQDYLQKNSEIGLKITDNLLKTAEIQNATCLQQLKLTEDISALMTQGQESTSRMERVLDRLEMAQHGKRSSNG